MTAQLHAAEIDFKIGDDGYGRLKVYVLKKISTVNLSSKAVYFFRTAVKASICNNNGVNIAPGNLTSYQHYPALYSFAKSLTCMDPAETANIRLLNYAPITINSSITTSRSDSTDKTLTNSSQQSVGSSSSQTNSFGVSVLGGMMMEAPMWSIGFEYDYAYTKEHNQERSASTGNSAGQQNAFGETFSIKDWGIYAAVGEKEPQVTWVCAQEYPWDVLQFRSKGAGTEIEVPKAISDRMLIDGCVLPPSQLSQFGTDFTLTGEWSFVPEQENVDPDAELILIKLDTQYVLASHSRSSANGDFKLELSLSEPKPAECQMTLSWWQVMCLALNGLVPGRNDASLNLEKLPARRFPAQTGTPLTITSPTNTLLCVARGFSSGMIADVATQPGSFTLAFKVTDTVGEVSLYIKHWKLDATGLVLTMKINGQDMPVQFVDAVQGSGGTSNRTDIALRTTDYMAEDFSDYLIVGLNVVEVTITAADSTPAPAVARYCLAAVVVS